MILRRLVPLLTSGEVPAKGLGFCPPNGACAVSAMWIGEYAKANCRQEGVLWERSVWNKKVAQSPSGLFSIQVLEVMPRPCRKGPFSKGLLWELLLLCPQLDTIEVAESTVFPSLPVKNHSAHFPSWDEEERWEGGRLWEAELKVQRSNNNYNHIWKWSCWWLTEMTSFWGSEYLS